jgi:hypothetical protein
MGRASDSREVLLAEALGDFVKVLDRIDAVTPTLETTCRRLELTADALQGSIEPFHQRIVELVAKTQKRADDHIVEQANIVMRKTAIEQIAAMQESARKIFKDEVAPPLGRVAGQLREANLRKQPPWETWLTHATAAITAARCTWMLMLYLVPVSTPDTKPVASATPPNCPEPAARPGNAHVRR